jgi:hypothetical protein
VNACGFLFTETHHHAEFSMSEDPLSNLDLQQSIDLRWTLRDIQAKRWLLCPVDPSHLEKLIAMGLVETTDDEPVLTKSGLDAIA